MKLYTKTICPKCFWVKSELQRTGLEADVINIVKDEQAKQTILNEKSMRIAQMVIQTVPSIKL